MVEEKLPTPLEEIKRLLALAEEQFEAAEDAIELLREIGESDAIAENQFEESKKRLDLLRAAVKRREEAKKVK